MGALALEAQGLAYLAQGAGLEPEPGEQVDEWRGEGHVQGEQSGSIQARRAVAEGPLVVLGEGELEGLLVLAVEAAAVEEGLDQTEAGAVARVVIELDEAAEGLGHLGVETLEAGTRIGGQTIIEGLDGVEQLTDLVGALGRDVDEGTATQGGDAHGLGVALGLLEEGFQHWQVGATHLQGPVHRRDEMVIRQPAEDQWLEASLRLEEDGRVGEHPEHGC